VLTASCRGKKIKDMEKNLSKIASVCRAFNEQFGDTLEGRGYLTVLDMLERAGLTKPVDAPKPETARELFKTYKKMLSDAGIEKEYLHIEINVHDGNDIRYESYTPMGKVAENSISLFLSKVKSLIEEKGRDIAKKQQDEAVKKDVTLK
jgi:hypothetical protein